MDDEEDMIDFCVPYSGYEPEDCNDYESAQHAIERCEGYSFEEWEEEE